VSSEPIEASPLTVAQADNLRRGLPLDLTPRLFDLQARVLTLEHLVAMNRLALQLILSHPDKAARIASEAIARIDRSKDPRP
jgi:hypothetical protein